MPSRFSRQPERVVPACRLERTALKFVDCLSSARASPPEKSEDAVEKQCAVRLEDTFRTPGKHRCSFCGIEILGSPGEGGLR
eukprot:6398604-Prymnesium_polylepis.1